VTLDAFESIVAELTRQAQGIESLAGGLGLSGAAVLGHCRQLERANRIRFVRGIYEAIPLLVTAPTSECAPSPALIGANKAPAFATKAQSQTTMAKAETIMAKAETIPPERETIPAQAKTKVCAACGQEKPLTTFGLNSLCKGGRERRCHTCKRAKRLVPAGAPRAAAPRSAAPAAQKICARCKAVKALDRFPKKAGCKDGHEGVCKSCRSPPKKAPRAAITRASTPAIERINAVAGSALKLPARPAFGAELVTLEDGSRAVAFHGQTATADQVQEFFNWWQAQRQAARV
jgi:hypothetical protein